MECLKKGKKSADVKVLQALLNSLCYVGRDNKPLKLDGNFGDNTEKALIDFQTTLINYGCSEVGTNGKADGICGEHTWAYLIKE